MEKTMYDVYLKDIMATHNLLHKIKQYAEINIEYRDGNANILINPEKAEELKNTPYEQSQAEATHSENLILLDKFLQHLRIAKAAYGSVSIDLLNSCMVNMDSFTREFCMSYVTAVLETEAKFKQPQKEVMPSIISMDYKSSFAEKEAQEQKTRHEQNIEILSLEHQQRLELEKARIVRAAFDEKATEAMQAIISMRKDFKEINMSESDIEKNQRYAAIYWCHQQAALLPANAYVWRVDESQNVLKSLDITANYLFKTFFPDLAQNEKE